MKLNKTTLIFLLVSSITLIGIAIVTTYNNNIKSTVKKCECGPTEHWFYKSCVKNYNKQFSDTNLQEDNDTEGLPENVLQAIELFASDIQFIDENSLPLKLELNKMGNMYLPLFKNPNFKLYKQVLRNVDVTTSLTAQELYRQWIIQFNILKQN